MLTLKTIKQHLNYDSDTGVFTWKIPGKNRRKARAGTLQGNGARAIQLFGEKFLEHRLAWWIFYGSKPKYELDHINGDRADNRIKNLRDVSHSENLQNRRMKSTKGSHVPFLGVSRKRNKFEARITVNRKHIHLGVADSPEEAYEIYKAAKARYHKY